MGAEEAAAQARTLAAMLRAVPAMGAHAAAAPFVARALQPFCSPGAHNSTCTRTDTWVQQKYIASGKTWPNT